MTSRLEVGEGFSLDILSVRRKVGMSHEDGLRLQLETKESEVSKFTHQDTSGRFIFIIITYENSEIHLVSNNQEWK